MVKILPSSDFRASRKILQVENYDLDDGGLNHEKSIDLIDQATWNYLTNLSDEVAIRTSNHYGSILVVTLPNNQFYLWL